MVNLEWYRSFVATYQTGTLTAAAERRFLTQPTLSQHIAALELTLKTKLFDRTARRMVPTAAAQKLYLKLVASIERLEAIEHTPLGQADALWLRLGAPTTYLHEQILNPSIHKQLEEFRLEVVLGETADLIEMLKDNELDLVIATQKISLPRLHYIPLQRENFVLAFPEYLQLSVRDPGDLTQVEAWLSQQSWISYSAQMPIIRRYWQVVFNTRPDFEPQMVIPDLRSILRCIELGIGVSILPDYLLNTEAASRDVHTPWRPAVEISNDLYIACLQDRLREPFISASINTFKATSAHRH